MTRSGAIEAVVRRDRLVVFGGLVAVVVIAWIYTMAGADLAMPALRPMAWTARTAAPMFFMWWIMMFAMMLPGAAPMILLFATVNRRGAERGNPVVPTGVFAAGYLAMWVASAPSRPGCNGPWRRPGCCRR